MSVQKLVIEAGEITGKKKRHSRNGARQETELSISPI
jgi:hypothetical protein